MSKWSQSNPDSLLRDAGTTPAKMSAAKSAKSVVVSVDELETDVAALKQRVDAQSNCSAAAIKDLERKVDTLSGHHVRYEKHTMKMLHMFWRRDCPIHPLGRSDLHDELDELRERLMDMRRDATESQAPTLQPRGRGTDPSSTRAAERSSCLKTPTQEDLSEQVASGGGSHSRGDEQQR